MSIPGDSPQSSPLQNTLYSPLPDSSGRKKAIHGYNKEEASDSAAAVALIRMKNLPIGEVVEISVASQKFYFKKLASGRVQQITEAELSSAERYKVIRSRMQKTKQTTDTKPSKTPKPITFTIGQRGTSETSVSRQPRHTGDKRQVAFAPKARSPLEAAIEHMKLVVMRDFKAGSYQMYTENGQIWLIGKNLKGKVKILDFTNPKKIGEGVFSTIYTVPALHSRGKEKAFKKSKISQNELLRTVANIRMVNKGGKTPWFTLVRDYELKDGIVMPKYTEDLLEYCMKGNKPSLLLISDVICAMTELAERGIVHGDMKPENILIEDKKGQMRLKVGDLDGIAFLETLSMDALLTRFKKDRTPVPEHMAMSPQYVSDKDLQELTDLVESIKAEKNLIETLKKSGSSTLTQQKAAEKRLEKAFSEYKQYLAACDALATGLTLYSTRMGKFHPAQHPRLLVNSTKLDRDITLDIPAPLTQAIKGLLHPDWKQRLTLPQFSKIWFETLLADNSPITVKEKEELAQRVKQLERNIAQYKSP